MPLHLSRICPFSPAGLLRLRRGLRHSFRLLNNVFSLLIRPVFAGGNGCLVVVNIAY
jgi:hypothetical protein